MLWLGAAVVAAALLVSGAGDIAHRGSPPRLAVGTRAPSFSLPALQGGHISLHAYLGHPILLNFWASWCPYCRAETASLERLESHCHHLTVLSVAVEVSADRVAKFANQAGIAYPVLLDENGLVADRYGATYLPTSILIRADGRVAYIERGAVTTLRAVRTLVNQRLNDVCVTQSTRS